MPAPIVIPQLASTVRKLVRDARANRRTRRRHRRSPALPDTFSDAVARRNRRLYRTLAGSPLPLTLVEHERLDPEDQNHGTWRLAFRGPGRGGVQPGDLLYLNWENPPHRVDAVLRHFGRRGDERVLIDTFSAPFQPGRLAYTTLRTALTRHVDLQQAGTRLLSRLGRNDAVRHNTEQESLHWTRYRTAGRGGDDLPGPAPRYREFDLLSALERARRDLSLREFLSFQDRIAPRAYSLSRIENDATTGQFIAEITVSELRRPYLTWDSRPRHDHGRSAGYLISRAPGDTVFGWLIPDTHRFPVFLGRSEPLVLVCTGSGISGALSLLRSPQTTPPLWLVYGVRNWDTKHLYGPELERYAEEGVVSRFSVAVSRPEDATTPKRRVTDALWDQRDELVRWIRAGAHIYLIGRLDMGISVTGTIVKILVDREVCHDEEEARALVRQWKAELRFQAAVSGL